MPHSPIANPLESADPPPDPDDWPGVVPSSTGPGSARAEDAPGLTGLAALRAELDRIDDGLHALLLQRARVVEQVGRSGKPAAFRPGREAVIIRRLVAQHTGKLPPQTLCRIWRELMAGTTAMQGRFVVAVGAPGQTVELAREHFGAMTPLRPEASSEPALQAVRDGSAAVAVLPVPTAETDPWWASLGPVGGLYVVAKLPFWARRPEGTATSQALVVATTPPDPSGDDRSLLVFEVEAGVDTAQLAEALRAASLPPEAMIVAASAAGGAHVLAQVAAVAAEDSRLAAAGPWLRPPVVAGGFAVPIDFAR